VQVTTYSPYPFGGKITMNGKNLYNQFTSSSLGAQLAIVAVAAAWALLFVIVGIWAFLYFEAQGQAQEVTPVTNIPVIMLDPVTGSAGTEVTVQGQGWPANNGVMIFLLASDEPNVPEFAVANAVSNPEGQFTTQFTFPEESRWNDEDSAAVVARTEGGELAAMANFELINSQPEATPTVLDTPTQTPVPTVVIPTVAVDSDSDTLPLPATSTPTATPASLPTEAPAGPGLTASTNLNVRTGPGTAYPVIGALQAGQSAEVTGLSYDRGWWQINFTGGQGWVSASYVTAQNTTNIPLVQAAPPPVAPTPTPTPVPVAPAAPSVGIWRAEYFNNLYLSGSPVVVRNEGTLNYNWGEGSPVAGIGSDNYSIRWTGLWPFSEGTQRFHARVDDGVRLYVDDVLVIDSWQDGGQRELTAERWLSGGQHTLRVEYYEHLDQSLIQVWSEPIAPPPPASQDNDDDDDDNDDEPEADFSVNRREGSAPLRVEFDNDSNGDYDDCDWDFGDGDGSDDCDDVDHTYDSPGTYTVWLRVEGSDGSDTERKSDYIRVGESDDDDDGEPGAPVNWHSLIPSDWRSRVPQEYHGAVEACLDHFNQIQRQVESPPDLTSILEDCEDFLD
jgi:hypothetical protein